jgi:hypothetical protein
MMPKKSKMVRAGMVLAAALALPGQDVQFGQPAARLVFDPLSASLRRVTGEPGAALLADSVASGVRFGSISPDGRTALILREERMELLRMRDGSVLESRPLEGAIVADMAAWRADSEEVLLAARGARKLQRISFRELQVQAGAVYDWSQPGELRALAQGRSFGAVISGNDESGAVYRLGSNGEVELLANAVQPNAVHITEQDETIFTDAGAAAVFAVSSGSVRKVAGFDAEKFTPSAVFASSDGQRLIIGAGKQRLLRQLNSGTGETLNESMLESAPGAMEWFGGRNLLRISRREKEGDVLLLVDLQRNDGSVWFVPEAGR